MQDNKKFWKRILISLAIYLSTILLLAILAVLNVSIEIPFTIAWYMFIVYVSYKIIKKIHKYGWLKFYDKLESIIISICKFLISSIKWLLFMGVIGLGLYFFGLAISGIAPTTIIIFLLLVIIFKN